MNTAMISRRRFLVSAAAAAAPLIAPANVLGRGGRPAPSNRLTVGCIGQGTMGTEDMMAFLECAGAQVVAVCDVDRERRLTGKQKVEAHYARQTPSGAYKGCADYNDFRELIARPDIDVLSIAVPDHWHAIPVITGARAGKDIYAEKPLALTVEQGQAMRGAVRESGRVFQTGSQLRSRGHARHACELVRNGRLGKVHTVYVACGGGPTLPTPPPEPIPPGFDYDFWLGPAPWAPYVKRRCHWDFRWNLDYSGGQITDHGAHYFDYALWGLGNEKEGPIEVEGKGEFPTDGLYNTAITFRVEYRFPSGLRFIGTNEGSGGATFHGTEGSLYVGDGQTITDPPNLLGSVIGANEIRLYKSADHHQNLLDCVKTRGETVAPIEASHRAAIFGHIGNIAMRLGRKLLWDTAAERFVNDPQADRMLGRNMRKPWHL